MPNSAPNLPALTALLAEAWKAGLMAREVFVRPNGGYLVWWRHA